MKVHEDIGGSTITQWYWEAVIIWFYSTGCREFASSRAYSKWMDLKALHDIFRFQHWIIVAKINWTQQFWIGNQFINTEECKFTSLDLINWSCLNTVLVVNSGCRNVAIFNKLVQFYVQWLWIFVLNKPQILIYCT